jgi:hypothetical protein
MSPTPDSTLDPQQVIGDLKRQLAESNAERDEAQAQKAAIAEILEVINSSPGDLAPVFDALLTKAMHLCDVAFGTLRLYDGERRVPSRLLGILRSSRCRAGSGFGHDRHRAGHAYGSRPA